MTHHLRGTWRYLVVLAGCLVLPVSAEAQVFDRAGLVKPDTVARADQRIQKLFDKTGIRLVFDIAPAIPADLAAEVDAKSAGRQRELFDRWAERRIKETMLEGGLYVLLCLDPKRIEVRVWPTDNKELFNDWYQRELRRRIIARLQPDNPDQTLLGSARNKLRGEPNYDTGLLDVVDYACRKLEYNRPIDQTVWYWSLSVIGFVLSGWAVLGFVRAKLRKSTPPEAGVFGEEESGRSIAVLGGGIGAVSSHWLLNVLFGRDREPESPQPEAVTGIVPVVPPLHPRIAEHELSPTALENNDDEPARPGVV